MSKRFNANDIVYTPLMSKVLDFVKENFKGMYRNDNITPHFIHLWRVACQAYALSEDKDKNQNFVIGLLHDIFEDTYITIPDLTKLGIDNSSINILIDLTKCNDISYEDYIQIINLNPKSKFFKVIDIVDNLTDSPSYNMIVKYTKALLRLTC